MADPTGIGPYLLAYSDDTLLPQSRALTCAPGSGLSTQDFGPSNNFVLNTVEALNAINNLTSTGILVSTGDVAPYFVTRQITCENGTLSITNSTGLSGNPILGVIDNTSIQKINFLQNTVTFGTSSKLNIVGAGGINVTGQFDGGTGIATYTISGTGGGGGGGSVSSVGLTSTDGSLNVTSSSTNPITSSGTFNVGIKTQNTPVLNYVLSVSQVSPLQLSWVASGGSGGGLTSVGITSTDSMLTVGNSPLTSNGSISLALNTVPIAKGGTGKTSYNVGDMLYYATGTSLSALSIGTANRLLVSTGTAPSWLTAPTTSGQVLSYNGTSLEWATAGSSGLTSVGVASTTGLVVTGSPLTANGTINVNFPTPTVGSILRGGASAYSSLAIGSSGYVLTSDGTTFNWAPLPASGGNAAQGVLNSSGTLTVADTSVTASTVIVASGLQTVGSTGPAAGPVSVTINPGVGFTLSGDGVGDAGKGVGYTIDGGGGGSSGITTIIGDNGLTVTGGTGPTATISLPSATAGNLLVGNGSVYAPLAIGTSGQVLTVNSSGNVIWAAGGGGGGSGTVTSVGLTSTGGTVTISGATSPITTSGTYNIEVPNWSTVSATGAANLNGNLIQNIDYISLNGRSGPPTPTAPGACLYVDSTTGALRVTSTLTSSAVGNVVTATASGYGAAGSILVGSSANNTYQALAPGSNGQVLTMAGGTPTWAAGGGGGGSSVFFGRGQFSAGTSGATTFTVADTSITSNAVVVISSVDMTGDTVNGPASGPFTVTVNAGVGFTVSSEAIGVGGDYSKHVTYSYSR